MIIRALPQQKRALRAKGDHRGIPQERAADLRTYANPTTAHEPPASALWCNAEFLEHRRLILRSEGSRRGVSSMDDFFKRQTSTATPAEPGASFGRLAALAPACQTRTGF